MLGRTHHYIAFQIIEMKTTSRTLFLCRKFVLFVRISYLLGVPPGNAVGLGRDTQA